MRRIVLAAAAVAFTWAATARADDKHVCVAASERGQQLRDDGKYRSAREAFASCARPVCPALVQSDCVKWLADLEATSPSVVIIAKDDKGNDLTAVSVTVDGAPLATVLDGRPLVVDPGDHKFRYETHGFPAVDAHVVIHVGEKSRPLGVQFGTPVAPSKPPPTAGGDARAPTSPPPDPTRHTIGWILVGVGAASLVGAGVSFGIRQAALNDAQSLCHGPNLTNCPTNDSALESDGSRGQTASTLATVFTIVGAVGVTSGIVLLATRLGQSSQSRLIITPTLGGASAAWRF